MPDLLQKLDALAVQLLAAGRMPSPMLLIQALLAAGVSLEPRVRLARDPEADAHEKAVVSQHANDGTAWGALADHYEEKGEDPALTAHLREHGEQLRKKFVMMSHDGTTRSARQRVLSALYDFYPLTPGESANGATLHSRRSRDQIRANSGRGPALEQFDRMRAAGHMSANGMAPALVLTRHVTTDKGARFPVPVAVTPENLGRLTEHMNPFDAETLKRLVDMHSRLAGIAAHERDTMPVHHLARPEPAAVPPSMAFVSPNTGTDATIREAYQQMGGPDMQRLIEAARQSQGVTGGDTGVGFWSDGAEASRVIHADPRTVANVAETLGRLFKQKSVLWFIGGPAGPDRLHTLVVPEADPEKIHKDMMRHGIEYKTVVPKSGGSTIHVVDMGDATAPQIAAYAQESQAQHTVHPGDAHFLSLS